VPLLSLQGRTGRARYLAVVAGFAAALAVLMATFWLYALSVPGEYENGGPTPFPKGPLGIAGAVLWFALMALSFWTLGTATVRRLHDRDKSGWWIFLVLVGPNFVYGLGDYLAATGIDMPPLAFALRIAGLSGFLYGAVELLLLPGTPGRNRYSL
jgi:uncharacterized membrane protein YhaH (DUF805 family)